MDGGGHVEDVFTSWYDIRNRMIKGPPHSEAGQRAKKKSVLAVVKIRNLQSVTEQLVTVYIYILLGR